MKLLQKDVLVVQVFNALRFKKAIFRSLSLIICWWDVWTRWNQPNMSPSQEFKDSTKTTPRRGWRLPGNPLYGCLTSSPWRDCSYYESHLDGFVDAMPRRRSQLLCWAIHFNGNQISSATKYLAKVYISARRFMSSALLIASTNKRSAPGWEDRGWVVAGGSL